MGLCTAKRHADKPALPHAELMELKKALKDAFPHYWNAPHAFKSHWVKCMDAISQACKRERNKSKKRNKHSPLLHVHVLKYYVQ